jgi:hypothetical protein
MFRYYIHFKIARLTVSKSRCMYLCEYLHLYIYIYIYIYICIYLCIYICVLMDERHIFQKFRTAFVNPHNKRMHTKRSPHTHKYIHTYIHTERTPSASVRVSRPGTSQPGTSLLPDSRPATSSSPSRMHTPKYGESSPTHDVENPKSPQYKDVASPFQVRGKSSSPVLKEKSLQLVLEENKRLKQHPSRGTLGRDETTYGEMAREKDAVARSPASPT